MPTVMLVSRREGQVQIETTASKFSRHFFLLNNLGLYLSDPLIKHYRLTAAYAIVRQDTYREIVTSMLQTQRGQTLYAPMLVKKLLQAINLPDHDDSLIQTKIIPATENWTTYELADVMVDRALLNSVRAAIEESPTSVQVNGKAPFAKKLDGVTKRSVYVFDTRGWVPLRGIRNAWLQLEIGSDRYWVRDWQSCQIRIRLNGA